MNRKLLLTGVLVLMCAITLPAQNISIVPQPKTIRMGEGHWVLQPGTALLATTSDARKSAAIFNEMLEAKTGFQLNILQYSPGEGPVIHLEENLVDGQEEAYYLNIGDGGVHIKGSGKGLFYGLQSLIQLLEVRESAVVLPQLEISDAPAFGYRGIMLDVSRHFFSSQQIKKILDLMAQLKFNTMHWHLTDDQGWRLEIKKYPKLTTIGAWRDSTIIGQYYDFQPFIYDGMPHGGYYSQEEARAIVQYAADRKITIIPEIELPGHSSAVLAAYPELGSFDVNRDEGKGTIAALNDKGEPLDNDISSQVPGYWGVHYNIYGPTPEAYQFLEDVLSEVMEIFPGEYIHIGGDEVPKDHWQTSAIAQKVIKKEKLADEHELQSFFIRRIEQFLNKNGRKLIGWDEILEGGLAPNATVMSWRGEKGGIAAAKMGHDVIMTPNSHMYFDHYQAEDKTTEPLAIGGFLPLEKVYGYNPVPEALTTEEGKHVLGVQANLWTEYLATNNKMEYYLFPRALALAEVAWKPKDEKNYQSFIEDRLPYRLLDFEENGVFFRIPEADVEISIDSESGRHKVEIQPLVAGARVYYTLDGHKADQTGSLYAGPILTPIPGEGQGPLTLRYVTVTPGGRSSNEFQVLIE
ncbi:beta-N-acetylhexosaminidase [Cyclobacterium plantarum]|uniref:beta-N-acetylhexosaminidase n=1 Tax=Cyclobacterium plantarum TaxID=2716263 RepID=A0ABX0HD68_9BACT|nr:family 20 glycosylhydrolase [Cyclobacterium plantarum]NHE58278.1 family 20 glycosylhydrolase [Cyclobacterium plantarum]